MTADQPNPGGIPGGPPDNEELPSELPILALKNVVVFPSVVLPIHVSPG